MNNHSELQHCFSIPKPDFLDEIFTDIIIRNPVNNKERSGYALWDTGATHSSIDKSLFEDLAFNNQKDHEYINIHTLNSEMKSEIKKADIVLPNNIILNNYSVGLLNTINLSKVYKPTIAIIGMDIIGCGSFSIKYDATEKKSFCDFSINLHAVNMRSFKNNTREKS